jgi:hypothetical protein
VAALRAHTVAHGLFAAIRALDEVDCRHGMMGTAHIALGLTRFTFWYWHGLTPLYVSGLNRETNSLIPPTLDSSRIFVLHLPDTHNFPGCG